MRSQSHPQPARNGVKSLIDALIRAICDVSTVYALLGDLIAARTRTVKRSDYSEPPDASFAVQSVWSQRCR